VVGGEVDVSAAGPRLGEAQGAAQIAGGGDLAQGDAGVLLVLGAQAAVVGAAPVRLGAVGARQAGRLAVLVAVEVGDVGADEVFDGAVFGAALAEVDAAVANDDLRIQQPTAVRAAAGVDSSPRSWQRRKANRHSPGRIAIERSQKTQSTLLRIGTDRTECGPRRPICCTAGPVAGAGRAGKKFTEKEAADPYRLSAD